MQPLPCPAAGSPESEETVRCIDPGLRYLEPGTPSTWEVLWTLDAGSRGRSATRLRWSNSFGRVSKAWLNNKLCNSVTLGDWHAFCQGAPRFLQDIPRFWTFFPGIPCFYQDIFYAHRIEHHVGGQQYYHLFYAHRIEHHVGGQQYYHLVLSSPLQLSARQTCW